MVVSHSCAWPRLGALRLGQRPGGAAHGLDPACDKSVAFAGQDRTGGQVHGVQARGAVAVDRQAGDIDGKAGQQRRHAGHVTVVLARLVAAAGEHVVQQGRVDAGACHEGLEHFGQLVVRPHT